MPYMTSPQNLAMAQQLRAMSPSAQPQPNGWSGKIGASLGNNSNMLIGLGLGLLDKRQNNQVPFSQIGQQAMGGAQLDQQQKAKNLTVDWLMRSKGLSEQDAQTAVANPVVLSSFLSPKTETQSTDDIKEFQFSKQEGFEGTFEDWMRSKRENLPQYGVSPVYGKDAEGNPAIIQLSQSGQPIQTPMPDGFNLAPGFEKVDLVTEWGILDRTGQITQRIPKDIAGAEYQQAVGAGQGAAAVSIPKVEQAADMMLRMINDVKNDPNREGTTGWQANIYQPRGGDRYSFQKKSDQLRGQAFMQAFETLKGGGAISEKEGQAATDAITRLDTSLSDEEYLSALNDLEAIINTAVDRARQRAGQTSDGLPQPPQSAMPDLYQKYGLE